MHPDRGSGCVTAVRLRRYGATGGRASRFTLPVVACGVSYASLVLTHYEIGAGAREKLSDGAAQYLSPALADKVDELLDCAFCVSFWLSLAAARGNPVKATVIAGIAQIPTSLVLIATTD